MNVKGTFTTTPWGQDYYGRVTCPSRGTLMMVIPPLEETGMWTYVVRALDTEALMGVFEYPSQYSHSGVIGFASRFWRHHDAVVARYHQAIDLTGTGMFILHPA